MNGFILEALLHQLWLGKGTCTEYNWYLYIIYSAEKETPVIHVYDGRGSNEEIAVLDKIHAKPIIFMKVRELIPFTVSSLSLVV